MWILILKKLRKPRNALPFSLIVVVLVSLIIPSMQPRASALNGSQFNAGRIIDDVVFFNKNAMSVSQIQNFLNSKVPNCETNHPKSSSPNDSGPQYTCLKSFKQNTKNIAPDSGLCDGYTGKNNETSATIIYKVAQSCGINPQVLLVMLQKEQSLVTDTWPWDIQYDKAMGAFCPDTAPCDPQYKGFFYQVYYGAHRFKVYKANPNSFNYKAGRNNTIYYHPGPCKTRNSSGVCTAYYDITHCKNSTVYIQNVATALLYIYTPYQPNKSALNNLYGTGDSCSSYGNRNFWRMFNEWFGNPVGPGYASAASSINIYSDIGLTSPQAKIHDQYFLQPNQVAFAKVSVTNTGRNTWFRYNTLLGTASPYDRPSLLASDTWIAPHRAASMTEDTVPPGELATFIFKIKAPASYNTYSEKFKIVIEGVSWVDTYSPVIISNVVNPLPEQLLSHDTTLTNSNMMAVGDSLSSPEGYAYLKFQNNGNLELYHNFNLIWQTKTNGSGAEYFVNQSDGNLVLYTSTGQPVWSSKTTGRGQGNLVMQSDGNLVLYASGNGALWSSKSATTNQRNTLSLFMQGDARLFVNQKLYSPDRKRFLILQSDGNLVLYTSTGQPVWSSKTTGRSATLLSLQTDGNLVLYTSTGQPVWSSKTHGGGFSRLVLQQDGNLVLYSSKKATWHSNTAHNM